MTRLHASPRPASAPPPLGRQGERACPSRARAMRARERIESLSIVANGAESDVIAHGMPPLGQPRPVRHPLVGHPAHPGGLERLRTLTGRASRDGSATAATFAPSWARSSCPSARVDTAGAAHGNGGAASSDGGNGHRTWHPKGGPVIAIAMATHRPPLELFSEADRVDPQADARELGLRHQRRRLGRASASRRCGRSSGTTRASACIRPTSSGASTATSSARSSWCPRRRSSSRSATRTTSGTRTSSQTLREALGRGAQLAYSDMRIVTAERQGDLGHLLDGAAQQPHQLRLAPDREHGHGCGLDVPPRGSRLCAPVPAGAPRAATRPLARDRRDGARRHRLRRRGPSTTTSSTRTPLSGTRGPTRAPARARSPSAWRR